MLDPSLKQELNLVLLYFLRLLYKKSDLYLFAKFYGSVGVDFVMNDFSTTEGITFKSFKLNALSDINSLTQLKTLVSNFDGCELKKNATNTVFCDGNPSSKIMLIGEAPGQTEDMEGIPFCGRSGKLLDKMLLSIGLDRTKVYITNTVFWRPPGNRKPTQEETDLCKPFVEYHIKLVDPKLIILVGGTAASSVLGVDTGISRLRGKIYQYKNQYINRHIDATAIFHPAYLLRQPGQKKVAWQDLQFIKEYIDANNI